MRRAIPFLLWLVASAALAQTNRDEARAHHELAKIEFAKAKFAEALSEFRKAYELAPIPDLLYNIGLCQERLSDWAGAVETYDRYLAARPNADERGILEGKMGELRQKAAPPPPVVAPMPVAPPPIVAPRVVEKRPAAPPLPVYKRWWFWTAAAAVVAAGVGTGFAVAITTNKTYPGIDVP